MYKERNIATCIIFSILTCGIYGIYWFICLTDEVNQEADQKIASGGSALLFTILTCGIYSYYWAYKMGKNMQNVNEKHGINSSDNSVLYLVLQFVGLGIVSYCLIQSDLNRLATSNN